MKTITELEALNPCSDGLDYVRSQPSLYDAWNNCERSDWMWWLLRQLNLTPKELSVSYSKQCADHIKHLTNYWDDVYATYAAANAYATYAAERLWQANLLRSLVTNPFEKP